MCSFDVSGNVTLGNDKTSWSDTENVVYICTLSYGTCNSFGSVYSSYINVYERSYLSGYTNQRYDKRGWWSYHAI